MVHGCMVYTEHAETAAISHHTSHVSTSVDIQKKKEKKKLVTYVESHASTVSLLKSWKKKAPNKSDQQQQQHIYGNALQNKKYSCNIC